MIFIQHYKAVKLLSTTKCELSVRMSTGTIAKLGIADYQSQDGVPFFSWILEVIEAANELLEIAQVSDYPVEINEFVQKGPFILKAHEVIGLRGGKLSSFAEIKLLVDRG
jgi:hypothetical protein